MNKLRDIIYNISDILVTLIIIAAALLLISWRVSAIMDYGSGEDISQDTQIESNVDEGQDGGGGNEGSDAADNTDANNNADDTGGAANDDRNASASGDISFTVSSNQTADSIGQALADAGLVTDKQTFITAVNAADAATRLKTGTFTIPAGSSPEQIVAILTK